MKNIKEKLNPTNVCRNFFCLLEKKNKWLLFGVTLIVVFGCVFLWYHYVQNPGWSEERKQEYRKSKEKETVLKKSKFDEIFLDKEERARRFHEKIEGITDIFRLKN